MKDLLEKVNAQQLLTVAFLGVAVVMSIINGNENIAMGLGGGLVGYLSNHNKV